MLKEKGGEIMHEKLQEYFRKKEFEEQKRREELLIREGLYEKAYMPEGGSLKEYDFIEFDENGQNERRFKKVAIAVTDEEYEQVKRLAKARPTAPAGLDLSWDPALALRIGAVLFLLVALLSLLSGEEAFFSALYAFFGAVTLGFAEMVAALKK